MIKGVLIGDPVEQSISHVTHNAIFQKSGVSACYEKWVTTERDLGALRERDDVAWFAVTMPLKEVIAPYLDEGVGPVNTILVRDGRWIGYNIDGIACLNAIGDVRGKRVLVLGNGGAAKSAIQEAHLRGAEVFVWTRSNGYVIEPPYDIVIQATPVKPLDPWFVEEGTVVLDMVYNPAYTPFLKEAKLRGATIKFGWHMFAEVSYLQFQLVFGDRISKELVFREVKTFYNDMILSIG